MDSDLGNDFIEELEILVDIFEEFVDSWGGVIDDIHTVMSVEQMDETADLLDRLVTAGEDLLGDGGELDESDEETGGGGV